MNLEKLKDSARKFEQKEDWRRAIEVYLKAIQQIESGAETSPDLSLYNRVGDLYLKTNDTAAAVRSYERAVDLYADQGFFNNAIALCGKILRVNPGRTQTYLKLAQLHARKNVVIEAKRNLIEFLERMNALGQLDQAFQSVKEFADQFSGSQEIRMMLVELLRAASREDEAREQLDKLATQLEARGPRPTFQRPAPVTEDEGPPMQVPPSRAMSGLVFLDTGMDVPTVPPPRAGVEAPDGLMVNEPAASVEADGVPALVDEPLAVPADLEPLPGLEQSQEIELDPYAAGDHSMGLERTEPADLEISDAPEPMLDDALLESGDELLSVEGAPAAAAAAEIEDLDLDVEEPAPTAGLPLIDEGATTGLVADLEARVLDDPENPEHHRQLAEALLAGVDAGRGLEELEIALEGYEREERWEPAASIAVRLVSEAPDVIRYHQKRVELAYRAGAREPLLDAYLALGDALARVGATDKAAAVYKRVLEHDPGNGHAHAALAGLAVPADEPKQPAPPAVRRAMTPPAPSASVAVPAAEPEEVAEAAAERAEPPKAAPSTAAPAGAASGASFVDLGSMIIDEGGSRDTRMRIDRREPQDEDEQREFHEILEQFKRGIEQNLEVDDYQAHYDLGIAFKEMGLLDEAIAEFQKALRAPEGRLRTSEALGICFFDKGQFGISETVLRRAVDTIDGGDEAKIGLLYWLGRAAEAQGKAPEAIGSYERALAVDIRFMDLSERIHRLTAGRRE